MNHCKSEIEHSDNINHLSTVHEAMQNACIEPQDSLDSIQTFRIDKKLKEEADAICKVNGTLLSSFLRECCKSLVADYK